MLERVDVAVVGAGPAGCAAAAQVLRHRPDARVVLLDRADFPRDKPCGDGIAGEVLDLLDDLGLDGVALVRGYRPATRLRIRAPHGLEVDRALRTPAYVIPRRTFDARLLDQVRDRGGVLVRHRARTVQVRADAVLVDGRFEAGVVVGADGAESIVRRSLTGATLPHRSVAVAIRGYAPEPAGQPGTQLLAMSTRRWPAYAWSFPVGDGSANVGYGEPLLRRAVTRADLLAGLHDLLPGVQAEPGSLRAHRLPLSTGRPRIPDGRVLLAGDAQALVNPLTGEGIFYAVLSGALAGACTRYGPQAGQAYRRAMRTHLARYLRHVGVLAWASRWPALMDAGVAAAARDQRTFDDVVDLGLVAGHVTPRLAAQTLRALATRWRRAMPDDRSARVQTSYDAVAGAYDKQLGDELDGKPLDRALLAAFVELVGSGTIADLGCGPGHVTRFLAARHADVIGVDLSPAMIAIARDRAPDLTFEVGSMLQLPVDEGVWAGAVALYSIIHMTDEQLATACREFARVLGLGGWLLVAFHVESAEFAVGTSHHLTSWFGADVDLDGRFLDPDDVLGVLQDAGFTVVARLDRQPIPDVEYPSRRCYLLAQLH